MQVRAVKGLLQKLGQIIRVGSNQINQHGGLEEIMEWILQSVEPNVWQNLVDIKKPGLYIFPFRHDNVTVLLYSTPTVQLANTLDELVWRQDMGMHYDWFFKYYGSHHAFAIITAQEPNVFSFYSYGPQASVCARPVPDQPDTLLTVTGPDKITLYEDFNRDIVW